MAKIKLKNGAFLVDGKPTYISAAEVQYFRTQRSQWKHVIQLAKKANNNAISTYIPWSWHEVEEGQFDFDGSTHPQRNLRAFLDMVKKAGLLFVCKPGPYVFGEIVDGGHPQWLLDTYPEILALDSDDALPLPSHTPPVTFTHPIYIEKVGNWYKTLVEQVTSDYDNICLWQVDNESCYTYLLLYERGTALDYNPMLKASGMYSEFLKDKFGTIKRLNNRYGSDYDSFESVEPPRDPAAFVDRNSVGWGTDWIEFKSLLIGRHHKRLAEMLYDLGVKGPFCVNQPLNGLTGCFPYLQKIYNDDRFDIGIVHVDHSGEMFLYNAGKMIGNATLFGSWFDSPILGSTESQASNISGTWCNSAGGSYNIYYRMLVAAGLNFHTPYWFNDGENVAGRAFYGAAHHFESPVDHEGNTRYHFDIIRRVNGFLMKHPEIVTLKPVHGAVLAQSREYDIASRIETGGVGNARNDLGTFRNALVWTNQLFTWATIEDQELSTRLPLIVVSYDFLPRAVQKKLVNFVSEGGRLILAGQVPTLDENGKTCRILARALGVRRVSIAPPIRPRRARAITMINMFGAEIIAHEPVHAFTGDFDPIAMAGDHVVGFEKQIDKGTAAVLGFFFRGYTLSERECLSKLLGKKYNYGYLMSFVRKKGKRKLTTWLNLGEEEEIVQVGRKKLRIPPKNARFVYFDGKRFHTE